MATQNTIWELLHDVGPTLLDPFDQALTPHDVTRLGNSVSTPCVNFSLSDELELSPQKETDSMMPEENNSKVLWVTTNTEGENVATVENGRLTDTAGADDVLHQTRKEKIILNCGTAALLFTLAVVWIYYR